MVIRKKLFKTFYTCFITFHNELQAVHDKVVACEAHERLNRYQDTDSPTFSSNGKQKLEIR